MRQHPRNYPSAMAAERAGMRRRSAQMMAAHDRAERTIKRAFIGAAIVWAIYVLLILGLLAAGIYWLVTH